LLIHCCRGKVINVKYSEGVFLPLVIEHVKRMRRNCPVLSSVTCPAVPHSFTLSYYIVFKKMFESETYVVIFSTTAIRNISHSKKNSERYYHKCA
jgi:hypothetical protein